MTLRRASPVASFVLFAVLANLLLAFVLRHDSRPAVTAAACFDLLISIPGVYYWFVVRPGLGSPLTLVPILLGGLLRVSYLVPVGGLWKAGVAVGCELGIAWFLIRRGRHSLVGRLLGWEFDMLRVALGFGRPDVPRGGLAFSMHKESGAAVLFGFLAGLSLIEAGGVHLVVARWSPAVAWILTAWSVYGAVFLIALARGFAQRPIVVTDDSVVIRSGLIWRISVARENVIRVGPASTPIPRKREAGYLAVTAMSEPNVMIELRHDVLAEGLYGRTKRVRQIAISADRPGELIEAIRG